MNTNDDTLKFVELLTTAVSTAESLTPSVGHVRIALPLSLSPSRIWRNYAIPETDHPYVSIRKLQNS